MNGDKTAGEVRPRSTEKRSNALPESQITVVDSFSGWSGPLEVCLMSRADT